MRGHSVKNKALLMVIGGIMMLGGIVGTGMSALMIYILWGIPSNILNNSFLIIALVVSLVQLINGLATMLKSDKKFFAKPFFITDIAIIALSVILIITLGTTLPTISLTGVIVPLLHIIVINLTRSAA